MLYLLGSIIFTSWLTLAFKLVERYGLNNLQVIVINHIFCIITGSVVNNKLPAYASNIQQPWFVWACVMGLIFISLFYVIGLSAQKIGVAVTSVANKLSLVIPFVFSIYLYNEEASLLKIIGIAVALLAVWLTCLPTGSTLPEAAREKWLYILPVVLFFGSGLLDTMIKYVEHTFLDETNKNDYLIMAFSAAAFTGVIIVGIQMVTGKQKLSFKSVLAGAAIGIPNYFSIWCLLQVLKQYADNSSAIIPINNMGIVLFSSIMAWLLFREHLSFVNRIGILLAIGAIALIAYG